MANALTTQQKQTGIATYLNNDAVRSNIAGVIGKENGKFIMSVDEIPEQVTTAKEAASKTVYAEYGRMPLGLNT